MLRVVVLTVVGLPRSPRVVTLVPVEVCWFTVGLAGAMPLVWDITLFTPPVLLLFLGAILLALPFTVGSSVATERLPPVFSLPTATLERVGAICPLLNVVGLILSFLIDGATPVLVATVVISIVVVVICGVTRVGLLMVTPG